MKIKTRCLECRGDLSTAGGGRRPARVPLPAWQPGSGGRPLASGGRAVLAERGISLLKLQEKGSILQVLLFFFLFEKKKKNSLLTKWWLLKVLCVGQAVPSSVGPSSAGQSHAGRMFWGGFRMDMACGHQSRCRALGLRPPRAATEVGIQNLMGGVC